MVIGSLAKKIVERNEIYSRLVGEEVADVFLIKIGYILVDLGKDKMLVYRYKSLSEKSKEKLNTLKEKFEKFRKPPYILDTCKEEDESESREIDSLLKKLRSLEKIKKTTKGGKDGR